MELSISRVSALREGSMTLCRQGVGESPSEGGDILLESPGQGKTQLHKIWESI